MSGIYSSSGKTANPAGTVGVLVGAIGAAFSVILWFYHYNPTATLLGSYSGEVGGGGPLADQLRLLALILGGIAIVLGIVAGLGGKAGSTGIVAILLGVVALSYPIMMALNLITKYTPNPLSG
ncbi:MAG TPA: hypothetical protein VK646_01215 [Actinomycetota bacterium]|nr:hypothetical protein [Actinomycetota bacterium]